MRLNRLLGVEMGGPKCDKARAGRAKDGHFIYFSMDSLGGCESYSTHIGRVSICRFWTDGTTVSAGETS